jgi:hypothetical protein
VQLGLGEPADVGLGDRTGLDRRDHRLEPLKLLDHRDQLRVGARGPQGVDQVGDLGPRLGHHSDHTHRTDRCEFGDPCDCHGNIQAPATDTQRDIHSLYGASGDISQNSLAATTRSTSSNGEKNAKGESHRNQKATATTLFKNSQP